MGAVARPGGVISMWTAGDVKMMRYREREGIPSVLVRLLLDGGSNYVEIELREAATGDVEIEDIYVHAAGERLSETFIRLMLPVLASENQGMLGKLFGERDPLVTHQQDVLQMVGAYRTGPEPRRDDLRRPAGCPTGPERVSVDVFRDARPGRPGGG